MADRLIGWARRFDPCDPSAVGSAAGPGIRRAAPAAGGAVQAARAAVEGRVGAAGAGVFGLLLGALLVPLVHRVIEPLWGVVTGK
ncbi:hypothetical protein [Azospirillum formosense]|uniref:hypothetical protein n=1 Tax=Azospirillum formosense TaxID=861533 RepID=UPI00157AC221|nr:hypothetical protein [Azospirillum formosense]